MSGRTLGIGLIVFTVIFAIGLVWTQFFAFYERVTGVTEITVAGETLEVGGYEGIDAASSGLKLRACFDYGPEDIDPAALPHPETPTPLNPPFWFDCFDAGQIQDDLDTGLAVAVQAQENELDGIDRIVAFYPDGRAYMWRQLNAKFQD
jgi:Family of unknown function (DUF6446)